MRGSTRRVTCIAEVAALLGSSRPELSKSLRSVDAVKPRYVADGSTSGLLRRAEYAADLSRKAASVPAALCRKVRRLRTMTGIYHSFHQRVGITLAGEPALVQPGLRTDMRPA